jgi:hypothetical protein
MVRRGCALSQAAVSLAHDGVNTLTVTYAKPREVVAAEAADVAEVARWRSEAREGDVGCKPS